MAFVRIHDVRIGVGLAFVAAVMLLFGVGSSAGLDRVVVLGLANGSLFRLDSQSLRTLRDPVGVHGVFVNGVRVFDGSAYARLDRGPGRVLDNGIRADVDLKVGDTVLFAKYSGTEFKHEDEDLLILTERDILAVIEN